MALSNEIDLSVEQLPQNPIVLTPQDETDYNSLINKPKINNVALVGNKTSSELGLASDEQGAKADRAVQPEDLSVYRTSEDQDIIDATKQDTITDLATIRSGASAGATAVQPADLSVYRTSADQDIIDATKVAKAGDTMTGPLKMSGENQIRFGTDDNFYYVKVTPSGQLAIFNKNSKGLLLQAEEEHAPYYWNGTQSLRLITTADLQQGLTGKADTNLGNITSLGKKSSVSWIMPDYSRGVSTGLAGSPTSESTNSYTCPTDGWILMQASKETTGNTLKFYVNSSIKLQFPAFSASYANTMYPVGKGDVVYLRTDATSATWSVNWCNFIPCKGA